VVSSLCRVPPGAVLRQVFPLGEHRRKAEVVQATLKRPAVGYFLAAVDTGFSYPGEHEEAALGHARHIPCPEQLATREVALEQEDPSALLGALGVMRWTNVSRIRLLTRHISRIRLLCQLLNRQPNRQGASRESLSSLLSLEPLGMSAGPEIFLRIAPSPKGKRGGRHACVGCGFRRWKMTMSKIHSFTFSSFKLPSFAAPNTSSATP